MNANKRMKYASTPTYGMQKRGFLKKAAGAQPSPTPDFSQFPTPNNGMAPFPQPTSSPFPAMPFPQTSAIPQFSVLPQNMQPLFPAMNTFFPAQPFPMAGAGAPQSVSAVNTPPLQQQPNAPLMANGQAGFVPRQQGFVPPSVQPFPLQSNGIPMSFQPAMADPLGTQPFPSMSQAASQAYPPMNNAPFMVQSAPAMNTPTMGSSALKSMPMQPSPAPAQQGPFSAPSSMPAQQPVDRDKLWGGFLFGVLPILFIPCLFVAPALDILRYAFIVLCVIGLGAMWYRQMFSSSTRATVTIIYAALCIVAISTLLNGSVDAKEASASSPGTEITATTPPNHALAAAETNQIGPEETPEPDEPATVSEAEERLMAFMDAWTAAEGGVTTSMITMVIPNWASKQDNPSVALFQLLANRTPISYTIESITGTDADNSRTVIMSATINKNNGKDPTRYRFTTILNKENGVWYIDPSTLATSETLPTESAADPNATPTPTAVPRMTETPVPDGNTMLYYNPNKGSFYHLNPECPRVESKYLPLQGSFPYYDLKQYSKLDPCLQCNAPTKALED